MRRYANRRDANEPGIVEALRKIGCSVFPLNLPVDLLVGYRGVNILLEVKDGDKVPSRRKKTEQQEEFMRAWNGQVIVVKSRQEAIQCVLNCFNRYGQESNTDARTLDSP